MFESFELLCFIIKFSHYLGNTCAMMHSTVYAMAQCLSRLCIVWKWLNIFSDFFTL